MHSQSPEGTYLFAKIASGACKGCTEPALDNGKFKNLIHAIFWHFTFANSRRSVAMAISDRRVGCRAKEYQTQHIHSVTLLPANDGNVRVAYATH